MKLQEKRAAAPRVFSDFSNHTMARVSEDHFFESLTCFSILPDVQVHEGIEMIRVMSPGIPNWLTNAVFRCRLSPDKLDAAIAATNEYFSSEGVTPHWRLCPGDSPTDLEAHLIRQGLSLEEVEPAMAIDLENLNLDGRTPEGFVIERVADAATLKERNVVISKVGAGRSLGTLLMELFIAYGFESDSAWQHYIGVLNGKPVSCASVFYATGVAGIYMVETVAEARRQGIGSAITLQALLDARERGYRVGLLQSSEMGYEVYRRLGFKTCFKIKTYGSAAALERS
jgi:ribosomal protein S18 acetylase RimI-like enzyme